MDSSIFKAYDIRGLAPEQLDAGAARRIGKSLARLYKPKRVLVGKDMRTTSDALEEGLVDGLLTSGVSVTRVGLCSTPMFNFAVGDADGAFDLGVMVTASHNPSKYNGFKIIKSDCLPIGQGSGMEELRDLACGDEPLLENGKKGKEDEDGTLLARYLKKVQSLANLPTALPHWRIAVDAGNGMDGLVLPKLRGQLKGMEVMELYWDLDGNFPHHEANPLKLETLKDLQACVKKNECVFGVAFDGDGDRVGFVDEEGTPIPGDILTAVFAKELMRRKGPGLVLYDVRSSWSAAEAIEDAGGSAKMCRVGHAHIKKQMKEEGALFAGELSMHFYFPDLWNCESGDLAMLLLLDILIREQKPLSQIWKPLQRYVHSGEINFEVKDPKAVIAHLDEALASQASKRLDLDGLRLEFRSQEDPAQDWWFNARSSNTEPLLRLNLEARTEKEMEQRKDEIIKMIHSL